MKLKLFKKYFYKVPKETFLTAYNQTNILTELSLVDNNYVFYSNSKIEIFDNYRVNNYQQILKRFVLPHLVLIISFIAIIYCFVFTPYKIRKIEYTTDSIKDEAIYDNVHEIVKKNDFLFKNIDINAIATELMVKYPHYAWIGVYKEGSIIYLDIQINDVSGQKFNTDNLSGDLVSKYDAYIRHIEVKQGHLIVDINQIVKKGDLIVSGNLNYNKNQTVDKYVTPNAIVLGEVIENYTFLINKKNIVPSLTGNVYKKTYFKVNNLTFKYPKKQYESSKIIENIKFKFLGLLIVDSREYEMGYDEFVYTKDSVSQYVESMIQYNLERQRTHQLEKIIEFNILKIEEENDKFKVTIMTREYKNIVLFRQNT